MRIYLQRTREHSKFLKYIVTKISKYCVNSNVMFILAKFIEVETLKYELGKRHLANMMGEDPAHFEQEDIDVKYILFCMKHHFFLVYLNCLSATNFLDPLSSNACSNALTLCVRMDP